MSYTRVSQKNIIAGTYTYHCGCLCISGEDIMTIKNDLVLMQNKKYNIFTCLSEKNTTFFKRTDVSNITMSQGYCNEECFCSKTCKQCRYYDLVINTHGSQTINLLIDKKEIPELLNWFQNGPERQSMENL
jgi:hypothetical protein